MNEKLTDPMDQFSIPIKDQETKLGHLFFLEPRNHPDKPGRSLRVIFDNRLPLVEGFVPNYAYTVTLKKSGSLAGNHYHRANAELHYPLTGTFEIHLEDPTTKEGEIFRLNSANHTVLLIKAGIAHKVISKSENSQLLVIATNPHINSDEYHYDLGEN